MVGSFAPMRCMGETPITPRKVRSTTGRPTASTSDERIPVGDYADLVDWSALLIGLCNPILEEPQFPKREPVLRVRIATNRSGGTRCFGSRIQMAGLAGLGKEQSIDVAALFAGGIPPRFAAGSSWLTTPLELSNLFRCR